MVRTAAGLALVWFLAFPAFAAQRGGRSERNVSSLKSRKTETSTSSGNAEVFKDVTIEAGKNVILDSTLDYSAAGSVAIALRCASCDSADNSMNTLLIQAFWSVPEADYYSATDYMSGSGFPYFDAGGLVFSTYGSQFRLVIQNSGEESVTVHQIILFRRTN